MKSSIVETRIQKHCFISSEESYDIGTWSVDTVLNKGHFYGKK